MDISPDFFNKLLLNHEFEFDSIGSNDFVRFYFHKSDTLESSVYINCFNESNLALASGFKSQFDYKFQEYVLLYMNVAHRKNLPSMVFFQKEYHQKQYQPVYSIGSPSPQTLMPTGISTYTSYFCMYNKGLTVETAQSDTLSSITDSVMGDLFGSKMQPLKYNTNWRL